MLHCQVLIVPKPSSVKPCYSYKGRPLRVRRPPSLAECVTSPRSARLVVRSRNERKSFEHDEMKFQFGPVGPSFRKIFFLKQERRDGLTVWHLHKTQMEPQGDKAPGRGGVYIMTPCLLLSSLLFSLLLIYEVLLCMSYHFTV